MQHPGHAHIVDKGLISQSLLGSAKAGSRGPDAVLYISLGCSRRIAFQAKLFAEVKMMLWFGPGHSVMIVPGFARRLYRVDNPLVARAAAKVAVERFCNGFPARCLSVLEQ